MSMCLWEKTCNTMIYNLTNVFSVLKDKTPEGTFTGISLNPSIKGIIVGYSETSKANQIYTPTQERHW
jgi:hypothetical protein